MSRPINPTLIKYYKKIEDLKVSYLYLQELIFESKIEQEQLLDDLKETQQKLSVLCLAANTTLDEIHAQHAKEVHYNEK